MSAYPLTTAEIEAKKTDSQRAAERGQRAQVSLSQSLRRSHSLVRGTGAEHHLAEIRDDANGGRVVFDGTYTEAVAEAKRRGLWHSDR